MSALGDYIHYSAANYVKYGNNLNSGSLEVLNYQSIKNNILQKIETAKSYDLTGLEDTLNNFLLNPEDNSQDNSNKIQSAIQESMQEEFGRALGKIRWDTLDMEAQKKTASSAKTKLLKEIEKDGQEYTIRLDTILKQIRTIQNTLNNIEDVKTKKELNERVKTIYALLKQVLSEAKNTPQKIGDLRKQVDNLTKNPVKGNLQITSGGKSESLITIINQTLIDYVQQPAINLQKGTLFEYLIAAAPLIGTDMSLKQIRKEIEKAVIGGDRQNVQIDLSGFGDNLDYSSLNLGGYVVHPSNRTAVSFGTSQGKIDVELRWEGKTVPISAKNIKIKSSGTEVHILSGASLLSLIQNEDTNFVNHFLNVVVKHKDESLITADLKMAREAMKYTLLYKAVTGDTVGRKKAEVFIINDNTKKGGVRVVDIHTLLSIAFKNLNNYATITADKGNFNTFKIKNDFVENGTYKDRLTNIVNEIHKVKIGAALKARAFDK